MSLTETFRRIGRTFYGETATGDGVMNVAARLGIQTDNLSAYTTYGVSTISRNRSQLDNAYRGSWLVGAAVDTIADDMTRGGIELIGGIDPGIASLVENTWNDLQVWQHLSDAIRWSRLYGGAIAVLLIDGQRLDTPLRADRIAKGAFRGLLVMDRWMVQPTIANLVQDFGPDMGLPVYYQVNAQPGVGDPGVGPTAGGANIHYTRCIRFDGDPLPFYQRQTEVGWGMSVLERMWDRLLAFDSATQGASQLVFRAWLRTLSVEGLREATAVGGQALKGVAAMVDLIRKFQSSDGMTLLDVRDKFETHTYSFSGLPEVLRQLAEQMSGALQIPMVRLFGQSPSGFSTGDADLQQYEDRIGSRQERALRRPLSTLLAVTAASLEKKLPEGWSFRFRELRKMGAGEKADVAQKVAATVSQAESGGLISQKVAMQELKTSSNVTGIFTHITDEDIEAAEEEIPNPMEMAQPPPGADGEAAGPGDIPQDISEGDPPEADLPAGLGATATTDFPSWVESRHRRGQPENKGQFASGGNGVQAASAPRAAAHPTRSTGQGNPNLLETGIKDGRRVAADGSALPPHIDALKIPPAWTDVRYAPDAKAPLLAQGRDAKGRVQSVYSQEFSQTQAAQKFARVSELAQAFNGIVAKNDSFQKSSDPRVKDAADCLALVMKTGIRPGSEDDTGAEKQAFGATTLQGQHVVDDGGKTHLRFVGKKGVEIDLQVADEETARMLQERAKAAGPDGKLFPAVSDKSLLEHTKSVAGDKFKTKDFRTHLGTATAAQMVRTMAAPTDEKTHRKQVTQVARAVAKKLGNTPAVALQSYIAPEVFGAWSLGK